VTTPPVFPSDSTLPLRHPDSEVSDSNPEISHAMSPGASQSANAMVTGLGETQLSRFVDRLVHILNRAQHAFGVVALQPEREALAIAMLRCLHRLSPESFSRTASEGLAKLDGSPSERFEVFNPHDEPRDGQYIFVERTLLRFWDSGTAVGFVGKDGKRYAYSAVDFRKDRETHRTTFDGIRAALEAIDPSLAPDALASEVLASLREIRSRRLRENFTAMRRALDLPEALLVVQTNPRKRLTHCYNCYESLDSDSFLECNACRWMVCSCGACGCGYASRS